MVALASCTQQPDGDSTGDRSQSAPPSSISTEGAMPTLSGCAILPSATSAPAEATDGPFTLLFRDEFHTLDTTRWQLMTHSWGGNLALFSRESPLVEQGQLSLRLLDAPEGTTDGGETKPFLGAEVRSRDTLTYGRVRARAKFARASAVVSALVTIYTPWPADDWNELDIESLGKDPSEVQFNAQVYTGPVVEPPVSTSVSPTQDPHMEALGFDASADFHEYTIEWTPARATFWVDGELRHAWTKRIALMKRPQNVLLTIWAADNPGWAGAVAAETSGATATYDWVELWTYDASRDLEGVAQLPSATATSALPIDASAPPVGTPSASSVPGVSSAPDATGGAGAQGEAGSPSDGGGESQGPPAGGGSGALSAGGAAGSSSDATDGEGAGGDSTSSGGAGTAPATDGFELLFRDDFDSLDTTRWQLMTHSWDTNLALFSSESVTVSDGLMTLTLLDAPAGTVDDTGRAKQFLGAEVRSTATVEYGRVRARARLASGSAVVSSLVTIYTPWPADDWNEFDIEYLGKEPERVQLNAMVYTGVPPEEPVTTSVTPTQFPELVDLGFDASADFHEYTIEWTPESARFLVDGVLLRTWTERLDLVGLPQNVLLTIWASSSSEWAGPVTAQTSGASAVYDWVEVDAYQR
jgi:endo-1,3-1,4-beta-glycanase ExoK